MLTLNFIPPMSMPRPTLNFILVFEHDGIKVTDGENDFEQNGVLELRLVRNQELGHYDKGWFSIPKYPTLEYSKMIHL